MDKQELLNLQEAYMEVVENQQLDEISKKLARSYVDKATDDRDKNAKDWMSTGSGEAFNKAEDREKNIQRATSKLYKGTPAGKIMGTKNPAKVSATGKDPAEPKEKSKGIRGLVNRLTRKEQTDIYDIIFSHLLDEGYAETPEAAEAIMVNMSEEWRDSIIG